jgi:peptidoglycan/xylan/chitin deacetylase (PgdA/CDA1 family)
VTLRNRLKRLALFPVAVFRGNPHSNRVALTFDDGPHPVHTLDVAGALQSCGVKATFFLVGKHVREHPRIAAHLRAQGHELASHSMTHAEVRDLPYRAMDGEIGAAYDLRHEDGSPVFDNRLLRPPKGAVSPALVWYCLLHRLRLVFWSSDPEDYAAASADAILGYFQKNPIRAGDIVLLHECTPYQALALPEIVRQVRARGLETATVGEMLGLKSE